MSTNADDVKKGADLVIFQPKADRAPPPNTTGAMGWLRENLFYSWFSTAFTLGALIVVYLGLSVIWEWGITALWTTVCPYPLFNIIYIMRICE